jgi:hypothetical protein
MRLRVGFMRLRVGFMRLRVALGLLATLPILLTHCATPPKVTDATKRIAANPPAFVEGHVHDLDGKPVAHIGVRGIPRGAAIPWASPADTACDGSFRLSLPAPGDYGFLLVWKGESVVTSDPRDPALIQISVAPGQTVRGIDIVFLGDEWRTISPAAPADTPSCP